VAVVVLFFIVATLIMSGGVKQLAEATVLLLLLVFTTVNLALLVIKRREQTQHVGFDVPSIVPLLGAIVCAALIAVRVVSSGGDSTAPLVAGGIVLIALALYKIVKPRNVLLEQED
jgi:amino acid transporter